MNYGQNQVTTEPVMVQPAQPQKDQAEIFAEQYVATAGNDMKKVIDRIKKNARYLMILALALSMPHQISYLLALTWPYTSWGSFSPWLESAGMVLIAAGTPVVADIWIVNCINTVSAVAASTGSKIKAWVSLLLPAGISGTVNFMAPAPPLLKFLAIFVVAAIPGNEILKFIKADWIKLRSLTQQTMADFAPPEPVVATRRRRPAKHKVIQIVTANPEMKARDVAKKAGVTENYVHLVRREMKKTATLAA